MGSEEDLTDLGYTEENLFDKREQEPLDEHADMETMIGEEGYKEVNPKAQPPFGLMMVELQKKEKSLNPTIQEALAGEDKSFWEEAMHKELEGLEAMGTWETTYLPHGMNTVDMQWVLKIKTDANLIPTKYKAYLNSSLHYDVYLKLPVGTKVLPGKVLKLMKGLYGLKQSGSYVDDMLIASPSWKEVDHTKAEIMGKWGMEDNRPVKEFLGIKIMQDRNQGKISLDLTVYIKGMVSKDPAKHWKLKHIDTRYYFIRDHVQDGDISIKFIGMANNMADILTKPLKGLNMTRISRMMGLDMPLRRGVEDAPALPTCDILNGSSQDQGIRKILGNEEDEQDAKLVGELM
ncbi:uncharacterized protein UHO2_00192 [Ustilago hordei]|uniref:uncharacterized protein n=1 Tax=Ustilago hordei TaxID=120017 RepID=UPI001A3BD31F|nr:uncharacterized protein UHO2_00192 [Ustilago hordei]SYW81688.1 uncharacterized protein UHO2_00192 [Ustilago hordei]